jgi:methylated-DNA-[protein]-cysteine S-methyltransferase
MSASAIIASPVGPLLVRASQGRLTQVSFYRAARTLRATPEPSDSQSSAVVDSATVQLREYFERRRTRFDVPLQLEGPEFHRRVWEALCQIPYGQTTSYGELARSLGDPSAARAAGLANGANPIAVIVPCHRVIGADGSLVGYGGGLRRKRILLDLESNRLALSL